MSASYRKRPLVIQATQFDGHPGRDPEGVFRRPEDNSPYVVTIHDQRCYLTPGDWIIPEPDGVHYYPCQKEIFEATYEPVSQDNGDAPDAISILKTNLAHADEKIAELQDFIQKNDTAPLLQNLRVLEQNVKILEKQADALKNDNAQMQEELTKLSDYLLVNFGQNWECDGAVDAAIGLMEKACWFDHGGTESSLFQHWHQLLHAVWPGCGGSVEMSDVLARATRAREAVEGAATKPEGFAEVRRKILRSVPPNNPKRLLVLLQAETAWMARERSNVRDKNGACLMAAVCQRVTEMLTEGQ